MIYSATIEYALRALAHIATLEPGERVLARDLAEITDIPRQFLGKILHRLARIEVLDSAKGRGGGFKLAKDPESITVHELVAALNGGDIAKVCVLGLDQCNDEQPCPMHDEWLNFRRTLMERVYSMTIADLGRNLQAKRAANPQAAPAAKLQSAPGAPQPAPETPTSD
ncbi:MAG: hypothetical protein DHS20C15_08110 [Planctomycetota bacterium]|nr:MAG: hypothetical protein DHS20C15_08110 [Planctomycetota bacterium]